jgi:APA family basic amino acid/polyamine antiporter
MRLARRLGLRDAVVLGLGAMLGAGVFAAYAPAAALADGLLPLALALAAAIAWANADSSARLAARHPTSGGAYAYGRARLSPAAGVLAGAAFLVGKTASAAAVALTVGGYLWPDHARPVAVAAVVVLTALAASGVERSARASAVVVGVVLVTLAAVAVLALVTGGRHGWAGLADVGAPGAAPGVAGVLQGAGVLFFAFAGYARIATLGEEVADPRRTLPRAIGVALAVVLATYAVVGAVLVGVLGTERLAASTRPVADAVAAVGAHAAVPVVAAVAVAAALASGLGVLLGLSRTAFAMARDGALPRALARVTGPADRPRPTLAQALVGLAAAAVAAVADLATALAVSSTAVLVYYGVAHAAALTLPGRARRVVPVLGLLGCGAVAGALALGLGR